MDCRTVGRYYGSAVSETIGILDGLQNCSPRLRWAEGKGFDAGEIARLLLFPWYAESVVIPVDAGRAHLGHFDLHFLLSRLGEHDG